MTRRLVLAATVSAAFLVLGAGTALASPAPLAVSWTPYPVKGFAGHDLLGAVEPKIDSSLDGTATAAWYGFLPEVFQSEGNVLVSTYDGSSWGCPIQLPRAPIGEAPPSFDVGADGTIAAGATDHAGKSAWVSIRDAGASAFRGVGTGSGYPADGDVAVATSGIRTVAVWISGSSLVGAEIAPGATTATPRVLATGNELAFQKVRMDAQGNAVVVYRSVPGNIDLQQNWLLWPAGKDPAPSQKFAMESPDDFLELGGFQVSPSGRMIVAANDRHQSTSADGEVALFVGTTTTGFNDGTPAASAANLTIGDIVVGLSNDGEHASVAFRWDHQDPNFSDAHVIAVNPANGAVLSDAVWTAHPQDEIDFFKVLQEGDTAYASWIGTNTQKASVGGVISAQGGKVTEQTSGIPSDWIGLFRTPTGPHAYWPGVDEALTTTVPNKSLNARPTNTTVTVSRAGVITVKGKVTPTAAARACAGSAVAFVASNLDTSHPKSASGTTVVAADGSYSWSLRRSELKGCAKAKVTTYLQTPDSINPVSLAKTVRCSR